MDFPIAMTDAVAESAEILAAMYAFITGACIGSFLNVVVYRMPAGLSLIKPASRCSACGHAIRGRDNIPIISWLLLGGSCRDCNAKFSVRYFVVELVTGLIFLALFWVGPFSDGANGYDRHTLDNSFTDTQAIQIVWIQFGLVLLLSSTMFCAALIHLDRHSLPLRILLPAAILLVAIVFWQPGVQPVPWRAIEAWPREANMGTALLNLMGGAAMGWLWGFFSTRLCVKNDSFQGRHDRATLLTIVGLLFGWQAVLTIAIATTTVEWVIQKTVSRNRFLSRIPWSGWLFAFVMAWMFLWRQLAATFNRAF